LTANLNVQQCTVVVLSRGLPCNN